MKKSIIALSILMACSASFAQTKNSALDAPDNTLCRVKDNKTHDCVKVAGASEPDKKDESSTPPTTIVYKSKNSKGQWIYSDRPSKGAQKLDLESEKMQERLSIIH